MPNDGLQVALLTVHMSEETVGLIRRIVSGMSWELIELDYENYFSTSKLPALTERAIEAQACLAVVDVDDDPVQALETAECLRHSFYHKIAILALSSTTDPDLLLHAMRAAGYDVGTLPATSDQLLLDLIDRCSYDQTWLTEQQLASAVQVPVERYAEHLVELGFLRDVRGDCSSGVAELLRQQLCRFGVEVGNDHLGAFVGKPPHHRLAKTRRAAGDDRNLVLEPHLFPTRD